MRKEGSYCPIGAITLMMEREDQINNAFLAK
jgi:hypothetical protein